MADQDISTMSDEDFLALDPSDFEDSSNEDESNNESNDSDENDDDNDADDDDAGSGNDEDDNGAAGDEDNDSSQGNDDDSSGDSDSDAGDDNDENGDASDDDDAKGDKEQSGTLTDAQLADIGRQVMSEIKANGTTLKLKSGEDAIRLIQMGANYNKKMQGLKPGLKTLKLLENHGLLDDKKLNYLIDLHQKKPEAITQLLKDSNIDPMDIDLKDGQDYVPNQRTVNDTEIVLDEILASIEATPSYDRTLTVCGEEWDESSRTAIVKEPGILRTINNHMESGIFDQVMEHVNYERSLGNLDGVSDFDAYQQAGTYMHKNNLFKGATVKQPRVEQNRQDADNPGTGDNDGRRGRKKAASPSRKKSDQGGKKDNANYDPLNMSDEEFEKHNNMQSY